LVLELERLRAVDWNQLVDGQTPLMAAILAGKLHTVKQLIASVWQHAQLSPTYGSCLHLLIKQQDPWLCLQLIKHKLQLWANQADKDGNLPLHLILGSPASFLKSQEAMCLLSHISAATAHRDQKNAKQLSPVALAVCANNIVALKFCVANKFPLDEPEGEQGLSLMHLAIQRANTGVI
jgi:ankyrin repeat protein